APLQVWKFLAVRHHDFFEAHEGRAVLGSMTVKRDHVADFDRVPVPSAVSGQHRGTPGFTNPLFDLALVIFHVQGDLHVGIDELKIRHGSLDGYGLIRIVVGLSMMRQKRGGNKNNTKYRGQKKRQLLHSDPPEITY